MTVAALILASDSSLVGDHASPPLRRLIEAAWSGGAHPILVAGLTDAVDLAPLALQTEADTAEAASAEALRLVGGTTAILSLPVTHAGIDPETITSLIAAHGRNPEEPLHATHNGAAGPIRLTPLAHISSGNASAGTGVECGDQAAITPSDGSTRLGYEAPPADTHAIDPWERRGDDAS
jgi:hypothetical protein